MTAALHCDTPTELQELLIVGVGNVLLGDEGLGVHVARSLVSSASRLPPQVEVLEAGTALIDVMAELCRFRRLIVIDAIQAGGEPGSLYCVQLDEEIGENLQSGRQLSLHANDLLETLATARVLGMLPQRVILVGAEPGRIEFTMELSPTLQHAAERISDALIAAAERGGDIECAWRSRARC